MRKVFAFGAVALSLAFVPSAIANAGSTPTAPLTLTSTEGWVPDAQLNVAQVETPAVDAADPTGLSVLYSVLAEQADAGNPDVIRADDTDAPEMSECVIVLGEDVSVLVCSDGTVEAS